MAIGKQKGHFLSFPDNLINTKRKFYDVARFPSGIRAINCTHRQIEGRYYWWHCCGWQWILLQIILMTPILKPKNAGEVRYDTAHKHTRCVIERCFGLLVTISMSALRNAHRPGKHSHHYCYHDNITQFRPYPSRTRLWWRHRRCRSKMKMKMFHLIWLLLSNAS